MARVLIAFRRRRPLISVLMICALAWLPGFFTLPPLDRDESRFAQATKQMLETHDFIDIKLGSGARYEKPAGIYWLQAAATSAFGFGEKSAIWTYRLPSFLGALAAVAACFWLVRAYAAAETAFYAALILGLSVLLMSEAKIAKTDAVLLATVTAAEAVMLRVYLFARGRPPPENATRFRFRAAKGPQDLSLLALQPRKVEAEVVPVRLVLFGWAAVGVGVLIKGPVIAIVCIGTAVALVLADRDWRWLKLLRPAVGMPVALVIVLPWAIAIGLSTHGAFYEKSLGQDFALKLVGEQETHGAPPGYYTAIASLTFWPGTLLLLPALVHAWMRRDNPALRLLLAWAASTWLMFEFVPTKLPHYVLPAFPALAALCATGLKAWMEEGKRAIRIAQYCSLVLFAAAGVAFAVFVAIAPARFGGGTPWWLYLASMAAVALVAAALRPALSRHPEQAITRASLAAILIYAIAGFVTVPRLTDLWLSPRMAAAVARHARASDPPVVTAGYAEPSIQFLLGTGTALDDGGGAARETANAGGLALVSDDQRGAFLAGVAAGGAHADALEAIAGLNYSRGRRARITLYRVMPNGK
jgi:4-amino-4-deoxy-L-arabinose transferase-like glycosyltransferase